VTKVGHELSHWELQLLT